MSRTKEDFFREIDEIYEEINRLEKKANFFIEEKPCGDCDYCCTVVKIIPICVMELDYVKNRNPYAEYNEEKFVAFLNRESSGRCPNYIEEIRGCGIYNIRPLVCRTFGYAIDPTATIVNHECCYSGKRNPIWPETEQQAMKFSILKYKYFKEFFDQIIPKTAYDYMNLAEVAIENIGIEKALEFYDSAEKIFTASNNGKMLLTVKAKKYETLKDLEKALATYCELLARYPNDMKSIAKLASIEFALGKYDDCIKHFKKTLEYTKTSLIYNTIGLSYIKKGEYQKALELYDIALKHFENDQYLLTNKSTALQEMNRHEEAITIFQSILERDNDNSLVHLSLSISFYKIGKYQEAQEHLQKAKVLNSGISL